LAQNQLRGFYSNIIDLTVCVSKKPDDEDCDILYIYIYICHNLIKKSFFNLMKFKR